MTFFSEDYQATAEANARLDVTRYPVLCDQRTRIGQTLKRVFLELVVSAKTATAFEIGAFEAGFSRGFLEASPDAHAVAFEANPIVHDHFCAVVTGTGVTYENLAISDRAGTIELNVPVSVNGHQLPVLSSMSSIFKQKLESAEYRTVETRAVTLDWWITDNPRPAPYALWVDVEGAQKQMLDGAAKALVDTQLILIELENRPIWRGQVDAEEIKALLEQAGFAAVLRDIERPHQFNALFARPAVIEAERDRLANTWRETADILREMI